VSERKPPYCGMLELRRLTSEASELEWILEQEREHFAKGALTVWLLKPLAAYQWVYLLEGKGEPLAYLILISDANDSSNLHLFSLGVSKKWQGQGLGRILMEKLQTLMQGCGRRILSLTVSPENKRALALYRSTGRIQSQTLQKDYYGKGEDRLNLVISLQNFHKSV
jgi:ribosomal protein S18 acetylase RimI-like enzyme